jgi:hypothetical protein
MEAAHGMEDALIWPNPVAEMLNLSLPSANGGTIVYSVIDALGREVATGNNGLNIGPDQLEIPVGSLVTGSYLLRLSMNGTSTTHRFVKQ